MTEEKYLICSCLLDNVSTDNKVIINDEKKTMLCENHAKDYPTLPRDFGLYLKSELQDLYNSWRLFCNHSERMGHQMHPDMVEYYDEHRNEAPDGWFEN